MISSSALLADALGQRLALTYRRTFGSREPDHAEIIGEAAALVVERLATSDALYHDAEHTALVTLVAQDLLRGLRLRREVSPAEWLHVTLAALSHDLGYVRGALRGDSAERCVVDEAGTTVEIPRGASDAFLAPYHVERSKIAVRERFGSHPVVDAERIARAVELTRFPVPQDADVQQVETEAGLVRAADLIGQLADPLYPSKLNALFHEFAEIGVNRQLGYESPADLVERYPAFYWSKVEVHVRPAIDLLETTVEGRQWVATLYSHVFAAEHGRRRMGPQIQY